MTGTPLIFLSYRRDDSADITGRIFDGLVERFGEAAIFRDIDTIPLGVDFRAYIDQMVGQCGILLAMIGPDWLTIKNEEGNRRLDDPRDFVRIEIESALAREIPVIPLLVREARMPQESDLPENLKDLAFRNAIPIRRDPDFHHDIVRLIAGLEELLPELKKLHKTTHTPLDRERRNELVLLNKVRTFWVEGVLERSLHEAVLHDLEIREEKEAIDKPHPWEMVLDLPEKPGEKALPPSTRLIEIFDDLEAEGNRTMLILGEPGSGKTISLLELARDTVSRAEKVSGEPVPVVFNLSAWGEKRQTLAEWLIEELNQKYQIPKQIGRNWVEKQALLLLLDGLDEVRADIRDDCVKAINTFQQENGLTPIVVCSRIQEYEALQKRLQFQRAVRLLALSSQQVDDYLLAVGEPLASFRIALEQDETLRELARSPLMLNIMSLAYRDIPAETLLSAELHPVEARRKHLFASYVRRMFQRRSARNRYSTTQTVGWLSWLAQNMARHSQSVFLLENLQPSWISSRHWRWGYFLLTRVLAALGVFAVFVVLFFGSTTLPPVYYVIVPLVTGIVLAGIDGTRLSRQDSVEAEIGKKRSFRQSLPYILVVGLTSGVIGELFSYLFLGGEGGGVIDDLIFFMIFLSVPYVLILGLRGRWMAPWADIHTLETLNYNWHRLGSITLMGCILPGALIFLVTQFLYLHQNPNFILWNTQTGKPVWSTISFDGIERLSFSSDKKRILTVGSSNAKLWDGQSGALIQVLEEYDDIDTAIFSPDETRILTVGSSNAKLWDGQSGALIQVLEGYDEIDTAIFSPDGSRILTNGCEKNDEAGYCIVYTVRLWSGQSGFPLKVTEINNGVSSAIFSPDGTRFLTTGYHTVWLWDGQSGTLLKVLEGYDRIDTAIFSPDGSRILTTGCEKNDEAGYCIVYTARLWDGQSGEMLKVLEGHDENDTAIFSPDGSRILTVGCDDWGDVEAYECINFTTWLWDGQSGVPLKILEGQNQIDTAIFSPKGDRILTVDYYTVRLWDAQNGALVKVLEGYSPIFNPDGDRILTADYHTVWVWDAQNGALVNGWEENLAKTTVFSPDGTRILTVDNNGNTRLRDGQSGRLLQVLNGLVATNILIFSPDDTLLVTKNPLADDYRGFTMLIFPILLIGILVSFQANVVETKTKPNQGIHLTFRNAILFAMILVAVLFALFTITFVVWNVLEGYDIQTIFKENFNFDDIKIYLALGGLLAWWVFLGYGGVDVVYHYSLRLLLILQSCTPRRYAHFLDYAADRIFLQKVGGGYYIFIHRLLLEYFASLDEEEMRELAE